MQQLVYIANAGDAPYGITVAELDYESGALSVVQRVSEISECHYLNFHPGGKLLLATTMDGEVEVASFAVDPASGNLRLLSSQPAAGTSPCYVMGEASGKFVLLVNYVNGEARGNIRLYPIDEAGVIGAHTEMIEHDGSGPNAERQDVSHPHMIVTTPDNRFAVVPDLGTDTVYLYTLDAERGRLSLARTLELPPGAGPRHVTFHPTLSRMYVINELDSTLATFAYDAADAWTRLGIASTLPDGYEQPAERPNTCADVHAHPKGRLLYGSNRGHDSLVIYALDEAGMPSLIGHQSTLGQWPRAFMIDPTGAYLIVGNRHSDTAVVFAIDAETGALEHRSTFETSAPIGFKMNL